MKAVAAMPSVDTLVTGLVDYAGLFPPAALDMAEAVRRYHAYRHAPTARLLGRFVVPAQRLDDFFTAATGLLPRGRADAPWQLATLGGADVVADLRAIASANAAHGDALLDRAIVDVLEVKASTVAEIGTLERLVPPTLELYIEVPLAPDPAPLLAAMAMGHAHAKIRTGGVTADAIPPTRDVAAFLVGAARAGVSFKATAGLHHAIRAAHPLTYAADSPTAVMHGFVNVFLAAGLARAGGSLDEVAAILDETDPSAFRFEPAGVHWRSRAIALTQLQETRDRFARSFGSCSFTEPVQDLHAWGLL